MAFSLSSHDRRLLREAWWTEVSAVAIYEAEVFWGLGPVFEKTLREECEHAGPLREWVQPNRWERAWASAQRLFGWVFGSMLCILPQPWIFRIHVWAEVEAAASYARVLDQARNLPLEILAHLGHAKAGEVEHQQRFEALLP